MAGGVQVEPYKVKKGDSFWNIVKAAGFPAKDWEKIYKAPYNSKIKALIEKEKRTPDKIFPGEIIFLPAFNKDDIAKSAEEVKNLLKSVGDSLHAIDAYDKLLSDLKNKKAGEKKVKKKALDALKKKHDTLDALVVEGAGGYGPGQGPGEKMRILWTRYYMRHSEGVYEMRKEIAVLYKNLETSKFDASIKKLEAQAKQARKDLVNSQSEAKKAEKELSTMSKKPY